MQLRYGAMDTSINWPTVKTWSEVYGDKNVECIAQYQTTPIRWKPPDPRGQSSSEIEYVIGTEDCVSEKNRYCNGPLKPGKTFLTTVIRATLDLTLLPRHGIQLDYTSVHQVRL